MNFGQAFEAAKTGARIARVQKWPSTKFVIWIPPSPGQTFTHGSPYFRAGVNSGDILPSLSLCETALSKITVGWVPSADDLNDENWQVV